MLPELINDIRKNAIQTVALRGINYSSMIQDGDMADSQNISARRYPYITTRKKRVQQNDYSQVQAIAARDKLITITNGFVYYDGRQIMRGLSSGEKQIAFVNTKMVIFPDKLMYDFATEHTRKMDYSTPSGRLMFDSSMVTVFSLSIYDYDPVAGSGPIKAGDTIFISGLETPLNKNNISVTIESIEYYEDNAVIRVPANTFPESGNGTGVISIKIPDLDYICESENRLWGCSSETQTIYASALGDPTNFFTYQGVSTDSYAVAVGSKGDFTGCCKLGSSVLFWKEEQLHKILGSYPAEYTMYSYQYDGVKKGSNKSLVVINEVLYYHGLHGFYGYNGSYPYYISENFGEKNFINAVAGTDGDTYFVSCSDDEGDYLFAFEFKEKLWIKEDNIKVTDFVRIGNDLYFLFNGNVYFAYSNEDDPDLEWFIQMCPIYESVMGKKTYSKIILRLELPENSYIGVEIRQDEGKWKEVCKAHGFKRNTISIALPRMRCDKFEIRMSGKGPMAILGITREFIVGSEVI